MYIVFFLDIYIFYAMIFQAYLQFKMLYRNGPQSFFCNSVTSAKVTPLRLQGKLSHPFRSVGKLSLMETGLNT